MQQYPFTVPFRGASIRGTTYLPPTASRHPTVLLLHSFTGNRIETGFLFVEICRDLAQRGMACVTFDFRNSGESDGLFEQTLPTDQLADALHMTAWVQAQPYVDRKRIALLGYSLGGLLAASASARLDAYAALVLLAPTTVENLCKFAGESNGDQRVIVGPHALHPEFFNDLRTLDPLSDCRSSAAASLLVQGSDDKAVPPHVSDAYRKALDEANPQRSVIEMIDGADHRFGGVTQRRHAVTAIGTWLETTLNPTNSPAKTGRPLRP